MTLRRVGGSRGAVAALAMVVLAAVWLGGALVNTPRPASADDNVVGVAMNPTGDGWWEAHADGAVSAREGAPDHGSVDVPLNAPVVGITSTPSGDGIWLVAADGGVFALGGAEFLGSAGSIPLVAPMVGMAPSPTGHGYWLVAADGGVFSYGDAAFAGSAGALELLQPIEAMSVSQSGRGYWLTASDGGVFAFGDADFLGSAGGKRRNDPVVGVLATRSGRGYWLVSRRGAVTPFGDAQPLGSAIPASAPAIDVLPEPGGRGYVVVTADGGLLLFPGDGEPVRRIDPLPPAPPPAPAPAPAPAPVAEEARGPGVEEPPMAEVPAEEAPAEETPPEPEAVAEPEAVPEPQARLALPPEPGAESAGSGATEGQIAQDILRRLNDERAARGLAPLAWDPTLAALASDWSATMAQTGSFAHRDLRSVAAQPGFAGVYAGLGENIAYTTGTRSAGNLHQLWMRSAGHRANILQPGFDVVGIGVACVNGTVYATENFGRSAGSGAPPIGGGTPALEPLVHGDTGGPAC
jgi:uncharacterized protein YkwD